jgi:exopolysaccharide biosynthesis operon protein EpsL
VRKSHIALVACTLTFPGVSHSQEKVLWPDEGHFIAYPMEPTADNVQVSASAGVTRDNNVFRLSDNEDPLAVVGESSKSDTISRVGVGIKAIKPISRQRFIFDANADRHAFNRFSFLDHWSYKLGADWKWEAGNLWSGDLGYSRRKRLADLAEIQGRVKDLITQDHARFLANYKFHSSWRVRGGLDGQRFEHSESSREALDTRMVSATIGTDYITAASNTLGLQFKVTEGRYPNKEVVASAFIDNRYKEYETSAVIGWQFAGKTRLDGRLGYTKREHDEFSARDFSGATGRASLQHTPSAKTLIDLSAYREPRIVEDLTATYVLAKGVSFGPAWAPTVKSILQAKLAYENREYLGDPGIVLGTTSTREDKVRLGRITAGYKPLRNAELTLAYERGKRTSNLANVDYDYDLVSANGEWNF